MRLLLQVFLCTLSFSAWTQTTYLSSDTTIFVGGQMATSTSDILNRTEDTIYQTYRYRANIASIPVSNGDYNVTLLFAETYHSLTGKRRFDVKIEENQVLTDFDILAEAGGKNFAVDKTFKARVTDGILKVEFIKGLADLPAISAIIVAPNAAPTAAAGSDKTIYLPNNSQQLIGSGADTDGSIVSYQWTKVSGPSITMPNDTSATLSLTNLVEGAYTFQLTVTDDSGNTASDNAYVYVRPLPISGPKLIRANMGQYFAGGSIATSSSDINNTTEDDVYQTYRYRENKAVIPVTNGNYNVTLKFAETYWSLPGKRRFDVKIENNVVLTDFDIFNEADGLNKAIDKSFPVSVIDGVLNIDFIKGLADYPAISAIYIEQPQSRWINKTSTWKYLDNGTDQGVAWRGPNFDDSTWASGAGRLGYGAFGTVTTLSYGPSSNPKYLTYYFRQKFFVQKASDITSLKMDLLVDDGAIIYINGVEAYRKNMSAGVATYQTLASADGDPKNFLPTISIDPSLLVDGENLVAVEVHQLTGGSSDLGFDMSLIGKRASDPTFETIWSNKDWMEINPTFEFNGGTSTIAYESVEKVRSPGTKSAKYVYDPSSTRAEIHSSRNFLGVSEGSVMYMGWSDYYEVLPIHSYTVSQWRNADPTYTGCPDIAFEMVDSYSNLGTVKGIVVRVKEGYAVGGKGIIYANVQPNVWYDYVVAMKYAKDSTGFFKVWAVEAGQPMVFSEPVYSYSGPTMYTAADFGTPTEPCGYNGGTVDNFHSPQLRMGGAYMWGVKDNLTSYKGPLRIHVNENSEAAFNKVKPK